MKIERSRFCLITLKIYYSIETNLNKYVTTGHEGKKPFKCNICDAGFVSIFKVIKQKVNLSIFI